MEEPCRRRVGAAISGIHENAEQVAPSHVRQGHGGETIGSALHEQQSLHACNSEMPEQPNKEVLMRGRSRAVFAIGAFALIVGASAWYARPSAAPPTGSLHWFLAPGVLGAMAAGGVHGGASETTLWIAWSVSNGLAWAAALFGCEWLVRRRIGH